MDPIDSWVFTCSSPAPGSRNDILGMLMNSLARRDAVPEIWLCCLDRFSQIFCTTEWSSSKWDTWADICKWNKQCSGDRLFEDEADNKDRNGKSWIINLRTIYVKPRAGSPHIISLYHGQLKFPNNTFAKTFKLPWPRWSEGPRYTRLGVTLCPS